MGGPTWKDQTMTNIMEIKPGDILVAQDGFAGAKEGSFLTVEEAPAGLFVRCKDGAHFLDLQAGEDGTLIGLRRQNRRDLAKAKTMKKVMDAATDLFAAEGGYESATIRSIATASGMSTGAIFANFDDKADLYRAIHGHRPISPQQGAKLLGLLEVMLHDSPETAGTSLAVANAEQLIREVRA